MSKFRLAHLGLALAALGFTAAAPIVGLAPAHAQTVSAQVGKPLLATLGSDAGGGLVAPEHLRHLDVQQVRSVQRFTPR